jgi:hypothetical protein
MKNLPIWLERFVDTYAGWFRKDSRLVIRNGQGIIDGNKFYSVHMATPNPQTKTSAVIDKDTNVTNFPELTGDNDADISLDWIQDIINGIDSWTSMDVYSRCQQVTDRGDNINEAILVSVYNPTIGCPYCTIQTSGGFYWSQSLDENTGVGVLLKDGRSFSVRRNGDSDVKEWKVDIEG